MSRESFDCLKRERDIYDKTAMHSQNTAFILIPALRGEKLNYKSVAKEMWKRSFFGSWSPVGIKVYRVCSIHVSV